MGSNNHRFKRCSDLCGLPLLLPVLLIVLCAPTLHAATEVGVAVLADSEIYTNEDDSARLLPYLAYRTERLRVDYRGFDYQLGEESSLNWVGQFNWQDETIRDDTGTVVKRIDRTLLTGLSYSPRFGAYELEIEGLVELTDEHDGHELSVGLSYNKPAGPWFLKPGVTLTYESDKLAGHYYWRDSLLAGPGASSIDANLNLELSLLALRRLDPSSSLLLLAEFEQLDDAVNDSDIITDDQSLTLIGAWIYRFK